MKRINCMFLTLLMISCSLIPANAHSTDDCSINGIEMSARRISAKIMGKENQEIARDILLDLGMNEKYISWITEEKMNDIAQCNNITTVKTYCKIIDGVPIEITESEYELAKENIKVGANDSSIQPRSPGDNGHFNNTDNLLEKDLYYFETKNAPKGTYSIISTYNFVNYFNNYHGTDILSHSGESLVFEKQSILFCASYDYQIITNSGIESRNTYEEYDYDYFLNHPEDQGDLKCEQNGISIRHNLKNNILSLDVNITYTDAAFMLISSAVIDSPDTIKRFNIYANYFHQKVGLGSLGVSVSLKGASVSVSPSLFYELHQISTPNYIEYTPY